MSTLPLKQINQIVKKLISRTDFIWHETGPRSITRSYEGFNGNSHMYYCVEDGFMFKIAERIFKVSSYFEKSGSSRPKNDFQEIWLHIEDQKRRFGRRLLCDLIFETQDIEWKNIQALLSDIRIRESTQIEADLTTASLNTTLSKIIKIL